MWKCKLGWHNWTKWVDANLRHRAVNFGVVMGEWENVNGQERVCERCGVKELRTP